MSLLEWLKFWSKFYSLPPILKYRIPPPPRKLEFRQILALWLGRIPLPPKLEFRQILAIWVLTWQNTPPSPQKKIENCQRVQIRELPHRELPHVETLSNPDNYSFLLVCTVHRKSARMQKWRIFNYLYFRIRFNCRLKLNRIRNKDSWKSVISASLWSIKLFTLLNFSQFTGRSLKSSG